MLCCKYYCVFMTSLYFHFHTLWNSYLGSVTGVIMLVGTKDLHIRYLGPPFPAAGGLRKAATPRTARQSRPPWSNCTFSSYPTSSIETRTVNDPPDVLDRQKCLSALASLRHAKWFQVCIHVLICT